MKISLIKTIRGSGSGVLCGLFFIACLSGRSYANCESLVKGPILLDVNSCGLLKPEASFDTSKEKFRFISSLPAAQRKKFFDSYRGLIVKGMVVKSFAVRTGLVAEKNALAGERIGLFIPPGKGDCTAILSKRIKTEVNEACCQGGGEAPCLLASALVSQSYEVLGNASSEAGDATRMKSRQDKTYKLAEKYFLQGEYAKAIAAYQRLRSEDKLDIKGYYQLGLAYRNIDKCQSAIPILGYIRDQSANKSVWADEEDTVRKAIFLLARCYSKVKDANMAVVILDSYLVDPQKYKPEIKEAMSHQDFGWIKTTKEYQRFLEEAARKVR
jgi:tetratricopeptide (TPR) repeat protein